MPTPYDPFIQQVASGWNLPYDSVMSHPGASAEVQRLRGIKPAFDPNNPFGGYNLGDNLSPDQMRFLQDFRQNDLSNLQANAGETNFNPPPTSLYNFSHPTEGQIAFGVNGDGGLTVHRNLGRAEYLNGQPIYSYDNTGKMVKSGVGQNFGKGGFMASEFGPLMPLAFAGGAAAMGLGSAAGGGALSGSAGTTSLAGGAAGDTLAAGAASSGTGLSAGAGGLGLSASPGAGLALSAPSAGMGITAGSAGASSIGAGIGTSGFAAGTGSLLGAQALSGLGGGGAAVSPSVIQQGVEKALTSLGLTSQQVKDFAPVAAALMSSSGSSPSAPNTSPADQANASKTFLEAVLPYLRVNSSNPAGSSQWTRNPDGTYNLNSSLAGDQATGFNTANSKFSEFLSGVNPNAKAPELIDSVRGQYSDDLAKAIYDRTYGLQANSIDEQRRALEARLVEQGFVVGNEGYSREMNRFEDNLGELRQGIARDAQIQGARQGLDEANFTNNSRTTEFRNTQDLQQQIATILAGARSNYLAPLKDLSSTSGAPSGAPANAGDLAQNAFTNSMLLDSNRNATRNDLMKALLQWGLA